MPIPSANPHVDRLLHEILASRVYDVARETSLDAAPVCLPVSAPRCCSNARISSRVFSFKLRGANNKMAHLAPDRLARGVVCASAGNHAQGVAYSARALGAHAVVVMPVTTPEIKGTGGARDGCGGRAGW